MSRARFLVSDPNRVEFDAGGVDSLLCIFRLQVVDVYRGEIQQEWHSVNRVFNYVKAAVAAIGRTADQIYVRIYVRSDCQMEEHVFVDWASTVTAFTGK